jgi:hypothetical protein
MAGFARLAMTGRGRGVVMFRGSVESRFRGNDERGRGVVMFRGSVDSRFRGNDERGRGVVERGRG